MSLAVICDTFGPERYIFRVNELSKNSTSGIGYVARIKQQTKQFLIRFSLIVLCLLTLSLCNFL